MRGALKKFMSARRPLNPAEIAVHGWFFVNAGDGREATLERISVSTGLHDFVVFDCIAALAEVGLLSVSGPQVELVR
jgi:hypothetical protein